MRKRDPRKLLAKRREAKARVHVVKQPETTSNTDGSVTRATSRTSPCP